MLTILCAEYVPCPLVEIKNGRKKILQQPVDLTNLTVIMAEAAVNFVEKKSSKDVVIWYKLKRSSYCCLCNKVCARSFLLMSVCQLMTAKTQLRMGTNFCLCSKCRSKAAILPLLLLPPRALSSL